LFADGVGVATFHELNAFRCGLIDGRCNENVDVVGHDYEGMEQEATGVAVAEDCSYEKFGINRALEVAMLLECRDGYSVCFELLADRGHDRRAYPRG
jgi:hypothetical protein